MRYSYYSLCIHDAALVRIRISYAVSWSKILGFAYLEITVHVAIAQGACAHVRSGINFIVSKIKNLYAK